MSFRGIWTRRPSVVIDDGDVASIPAIEQAQSELLNNDPAIRAVRAVYEALGDDATTRTSRQPTNSACRLGRALTDGRTDWGTRAAARSAAAFEDEPAVSPEQPARSRSGCLRAHPERDRDRQAEADQHVADTEDVGQRQPGGQGEHVGERLRAPASR